LKPSVSYYLSHPIQYFSPLLREMAREFDLTVYYFSDASVRGGHDAGFGQNITWDTPLLDGYDYRFIKNYSKSKSLDNAFTDLVNPGVIKTLFHDKSKVVIVNGWAYFSVLLTIVFARLFGKQVWLRAENPLNQELRKSKKVLLLKKLFLKYFLFPWVNKFLYIGSESKKFFEYYGVASKQLVLTPYSVNNVFFQQQHSELKIKRDALFPELGVPSDKKVILFTAKYIEKKRPLDLLKAFSKLNRKDTVLVMVGEGELRGEMEAYCKQEKLENVILTGFVNQSAIAKYYCIADVFVMCSGMGETWGLSVNEAMNFELPVIVTDTCGSSHDLVNNGVNGFVVAEGNIEQLSESIYKSLNEPFRISAGKASREKIDDYSINEIVRHLKNALNE